MHATTRGVLKRLLGLEEKERGGGVNEKEMDKAEMEAL